MSLYVLLRSQRSVVEYEKSISSKYPPFRSHELAQTIYSLLRSSNIPAALYSPTVSTIPSLIEITYADLDNVPVMITALSAVRVVSTLVLLISVGVLVLIEVDRIRTASKSSTCARIAICSVRIDHFAFVVVNEPAFVSLALQIIETMAGADTKVVAWTCTGHNGCQNSEE